MPIEDILNKEELSREDIIYLLSLTDQDEIQKLYHHADKIRSAVVGDEVHLRGIIDFSNNCIQNCLYCGLREDNYSLPRYRMTPDEIIETARQINNLGIYTIVLQSGEDPFYDTDLIAYIIYSIKQKSDTAITLSLGERGFDEYRSWKIAGADRYLLKHETANSKLYSIYHLKQKLSDRLSHLQFLKRIGYQIGAGNLIGMPLQTVEDIADDILMCKELDLDMASFSPFIPAPNTPYRSKRPANLELTLKTMAVARIVLKNVHMPATTALATLNVNGRIMGLKAGANVIMPDCTPVPYREKYLIYPLKNPVCEHPDQCRPSIEMQLDSIGRKISNSKGDSLKPLHVEKNHSN